MRLVLVALPLGLAFGLLLAWGGMADPQVIEDMLLLRSFDVFLMMGSGMAVAAIGARVLRRAGVRAWADGSEVAWTTTRPTPAHVLGSAVFGAGWAVSLTCPGPIAVQVGSGSLAGSATAVGVGLGVLLAGAWKERATAAEASRVPIGL